MTHSMYPVQTGCCLYLLVVKHRLGRTWSSHAAGLGHTLAPVRRILDSTATELKHNRSPLQYLLLVGGYISDITVATLHVDFLMFYSMLYSMLQHSAQQAHWIFKGLVE